MTTKNTAVKGGSTASRIEVETWDFEASHGRKPRGFGSWAFAFDGRNELDDLFWVHQSRYGDAVRAAKVEGQRQGATLIEVQS